MSTFTLQKDSYALSSWRARPRSFVALMSIYESNYLRLRTLVGDPQRISGTRRSRLPHDCELVLTATGRSAHTGDLRLTYLLESSGGEPPESVPDVLLRVYHDARLCEWLPAPPSGASLSGVGLPGSAVTAASGVAGLVRWERELDQRWARNVMLNKWLDYCLERGHCAGQGSSWRLDQPTETESSRRRASGAPLR